MNQAELLGHARWKAVLVFVTSSLLAITLGAGVMAHAGVPLDIWVRNPIAWVLAAGVSIFLARRDWFGAAFPPIALIVVAFSFFGPEQEGVHRWLDIGPVQLNAAALVLPAAIAGFNRISAVIAVPCFVLIAALLSVQPDISQLAGFAIAAIVLASSLRYGKMMLTASVIIATAALAFCLSRPDPLAPVAHVEGILALAWSQSPALAIAMGISLAAAALSPLILWSAHPLGATAQLALAAYLAVTGAAFLLGAYPVPLAGYGVSFVIGWCLGIFGLCARRSSIP